MNNTIEIATWLPLEPPVGIPMSFKDDIRGTILSVAHMNKPSNRYHIVFEFASADDKMEVQKMLQSSTRSPWSMGCDNVSE